MEQPQENKKILIITSGRSPLGPAEGFLKNRDWKVKTTSNLKEALIYLVQEQPPFVMVCVDHPNKKVRVLPKVLTQAFPVCVIAYTEESSATAMNILSSTGTEYTIYPPITGPAIVRTINKYYKDQNIKLTGSGGNRSGISNAPEGGVISIRGDNNGFASGQAQSILASLFGDDAVGVISGVKGSNLGEQTQSGNKSNLLQTEQAGQHSSVGKVALDPVNSGSLINENNLDKKDDSPPFIGNQMDQKSGNLNSTKKADLLEKTSNPSQGKSNSIGKENASFPRRTPEQISILPQATKKDTLLLKGTSTVLENSCVKSEIPNENWVTNTQNVYCLVIESTRFAGYLITAMAKTKKMDAVFLETVRIRLFKFLKDAGENLTESESLNLTIREVPFDEWALSKADFLRKSIHQGQEVAMAYFPRQDLSIHVGDSAVPEMATLRIQDIKCDIPVEFNMYVYLPKNGRYILYTPRGSTFYTGQKERLQLQGIQNMHIYKGDLNEVQKFRAQNYLNETIEDYEKEREELPVTKKKHPGSSSAA